MCLKWRVYIPLGASLFEDIPLVEFYVPCIYSNGRQFRSLLLCPLSVKWYYFPLFVGLCQTLTVTSPPHEGEPAETRGQALGYTIRCSHNYVMGHCNKNAMVSYVQFDTHVPFVFHLFIINAMGLVHLCFCVFPFISSFLVCLFLYG